MVALLNDARYQIGKGPLGFLNPFLYQAYEALGITGATQLLKGWTSRV